MSLCLFHICLDREARKKRRKERKVERKEGEEGRRKKGRKKEGRMEERKEEKESIRKYKEKWTNPASQPCMLQKPFFMYLKSYKIWRLTPEIFPLTCIHRHMSTQAHGIYGFGSCSRGAGGLAESKMLREPQLHDKVGDYLS